MGDVLFGVVTKTDDPEKLGRVQVHLRDYSGDVTLPWIRVIQPTASKDSGTLLLPEKDDHVVVLRGPGGIDGMVVLGCLYTGTRKPPIADEDGKNNVKQILTRAGNQVTFDDTSGSEKITIQTKEAKVAIVFDHAAKTLTLTSDADVIVKGTKKVSIATKDAEVKADGNVTIKGAQAVKIEGTQSVEVNGGSVKIAGKSGVEIG